MAQKLAELVTELTVKGANKVTNTLNGIKSNMGTLKAAAGIMAGTFVAGAFAAKKFLDLASEQIIAEKRLEAVIRATGGAAGYTSGQMQKMAAEMQEVNAIGDEVILGGMAILATFKNVRGEAFKRTTQAAIDMSAVMGTDLKSAMLQLGKAMNDPAKRLTDLSRSGVTFSEKQIKQVKQLVKANKLFEAQGIVLREVESQFGGAARAIGDSFPGQLKKLENALGDIGEKIGKNLSGPIGELAEKLKLATPEMDKFFSSSGEGGKYIRELGDGINAAIDLMEIANKKASKGQEDGLPKAPGLIGYGDTSLKGIGERQAGIAKVIAPLFGQQGAAFSVRDTGKLAELISKQNQLQAENNKLTAQITALGK